MLLVHLASLREGLQERRFTPSSGDLDIDPEVFSDIQIEARLDYTPRRILVTLEATALAHLVCDRTLVPFDQTVNGTHQLLYTTDTDLSEPGNAEDEIHPLTPGTTTLDLSEPARDTLLLSLPLRRIAPEAEEIDLNLSYGPPKKEDDIDPRWAALKKLKEE